MANVAKKKGKKKVVAKRAAAKKPKRPARKIVARKTKAVAKRPVARKPRKAAKRPVARKPKKAAAKATRPAKATRKTAVKKGAARTKRVASVRRGATPLPRRPPPSGPQPTNGVHKRLGARKDGASAFLPDPTAIGHRRVRDDFAEGLGEEFVAVVTSGEAVIDERDATLPEEDGGPFITSSADREYARGTDESNPEDAEREAFPTTRSERR